MDLVGGEEIGRRDPERRRHAGAVLGDVLRRIVRADAGVEARIEPLRHAARAREEAVPDAGERGEGLGLEHDGFEFALPAPIPSIDFLVLRKGRF